MHERCDAAQFPAFLTAVADMADTAPRIISLIGPTAAGKSAVAMQLAHRIGGEILSLDSMQVYRGMDIGTAKPTETEQREVRHHLIDLIDPDQTFTVARFVELADEVIRDAAARRVPLVAVGGTPLYYKALFEGLFEGPGADESVRQRLRTEPLEALYAKLSQVDPVAATRIHANDRRRLIRALEVYELTGRPISSFQTEWASGAARHQAIWFGLSWDKDALNRRINARVKAMIEAGWLDEARSLLDRFGSLSKTAAEATGYRELIEHVRGPLSLEHTIEQIKIATRQLARRQMKWLRRFPNVQWLAGERPPATIVDDILCAPNFRYNSEDA
jgi:tRNA dimethylallyltransferase